jgi:ABC-2 type transport system ATP-binding protein
MDELESRGLAAERLTVHTPDLDDVFLALTGRPAPAEASSR